MVSCTESKDIMGGKEGKWIRFDPLLCGHPPGQPSKVLRAVLQNKDTVKRDGVPSLASGLYKSLNEK